MGPGSSRYTGKTLRNQVGENDSREQTGHEEGQSEPQRSKPGVEHKAENGTDMDGKDRVQEVQMADALLSLSLRQADVLHILPFGRQVVSRDQELGDRPPHQAGQDEAKGRAGDSDFHCAGDPIIIGDPRRPGDGGSVSADKGYRTAEKTHRSRQVEKRCDGDAGKVLHNHIGDRESEEDHQRLTAR